MMGADGFACCCGGMAVCIFWCPFEIEDCGGGDGVNGGGREEG